MVNVGCPERESTEGRKKLSRERRSSLVLTGRLCRKITKVCLKNCWQILKWPIIIKFHVKSLPWISEKQAENVSLRFSECTKMPDARSHNGWSEGVKIEFQFVFRFIFHNNHLKKIQEKGNNNEDYNINNNTDNYTAVNKCLFSYLKLQDFRP